MLSNIFLFIAFIAMLLLFVKFEKIFLPLGIALALALIVKVLHDNAQTLATRDALLNALVSELQQEGYSESEIDELLASRNLKRPMSSTDLSIEALQKAGYSEEKIDAILAERGLKRRPTTPNQEP